jgi:hypothetical protein
MLHDSSPVHSLNSCNAVRRMFSERSGGFRPLLENASNFIRHVCLGLS